MKRLFQIKRPAAAILDQKFTIIGDKLTGANSFPSGHSITVFTILSVLLFAFMPRSSRYKLPWIITILTVGCVLVITRVAVGAHYPLDVAVGATVGYVSALFGIIINQRYNLWNWLPCKLYKPLSIFILTICTVVVLFKILDSNLIIFYFSLGSLFLALYITILSYVKKEV